MGYGFQVFKKRFFDALKAITTDQMVIEKNLERPIYVDAHDEEFVQCVSPRSNI